MAGGLGSACSVTPACLVVTDAGQAASHFHRLQVSGPRLLKATPLRVVALQQGRVLADEVVSTAQPVGSISFLVPASTLGVGVVTIHILTTQQSQQPGAAPQALLETSYILALPSDAAAEVLALFSKMTVEIQHFFGRAGSSNASMLSSLQQGLGWLVRFFVSSPAAQPQGHCFCCGLAHAAASSTAGDRCVSCSCTCIDHAQSPAAQQHPQQPDPVVCYAFEHYFLPFVQHWRLVLDSDHHASSSNAASIEAEEAQFDQMRRMLDYLMENEMWSCMVLLLGRAPDLWQRALAEGVEVPAERCLVDSLSHLQRAPLQQCPNMLQQQQQQQQGEHGECSSTQWEGQLDDTNPFDDDVDELEDATAYLRLHPQLSHVRPPLAHAPAVAAQPTQQAWLGHKPQALMPQQQQQRQVHALPSQQTELVPLLLRPPSPTAQTPPAASPGLHLQQQQQQQHVSMQGHPNAAASPGRQRSCAVSADNAAAELAQAPAPASPNSCKAMVEYAEDAKPVGKGSAMGGMAAAGPAQHKEANAAAVTAGDGSSSGSYHHLERVYAVYKNHSNLGPDATVFLMALGVALAVVSQALVAKDLAAAATLCLYCACLFAPYCLMLAAPTVYLRFRELLFVAARSASACIVLAAARGALPLPGVWRAMLASHMHAVKCCVMLPLCQQVRLWAAALIATVQLLCDAFTGVALGAAPADAARGALLVAVLSMLVTFAVDVRARRQFMRACNGHALRAPARGAVAA